MEKNEIEKLEYPTGTPVEEPNTIHGRLLESVHISGYSAGRACSELEWLLDDDRWKRVGNGYDDIDAFLETVNLSEFKLAVDQRKKLSKRLADLQATQRAAAKTLGVAQDTIRRDIEIERNRSKPTIEPQQNQSVIDKIERNSSKPSVITQSGLEVAKIAEKAADQEIKKQKRKDQEEQDSKNLEVAQKQITEEKRISIKNVCDIRCCSMQELFESGIKPDVVITDPPYPKEFLPLYDELAQCCNFHKVPVVAVMCGQSYLPQIIEMMCRHLVYRWTFAYLTPGGQAVQQWSKKINTFWKPVLLFGDVTEWVGDVCKSDVNDNDKRFHEWGQSESGMADLISRLTKPGQLICDPFLGGGTTAVVSLALGRRFVGCDIDKECCEKSIQRVETADV